MASDHLLEEGLLARSSSMTSHNSRPSMRMWTLRSSIPSLRGFINFVLLTCFILVSFCALPPLVFPLFSFQPTAKPLELPPFPITADISPLACHSHNDYWRAHPLYDALLAGCVSVEADIWFLPSSPHELYVGHLRESLTPSRTLAAMYIDPLVELLEAMNGDRGASLDRSAHDRVEKAAAQDDKLGVFDTDHTQVLTLLIDFKTKGVDLLPRLVKALEPLRERGFLVKWDGEAVIPAPIVVVATGDFPFDEIVALGRRDIFVDAPLEFLVADGDDDEKGIFKYNHTNSVYASMSLEKLLDGERPTEDVLQGAVGKKIDAQVVEAKKRGLKARYWETPAWPIGVRNSIWKGLWEKGVGVLNVDDLEGAKGFWHI